MKKLLLVTLLTQGMVLIGQNVFTLHNDTDSKLEVKLRLGSNSNTYQLDGQETREITTDKYTCLNKVQATALTGALKSQQAVIPDVKGCSGKNIFFASEGGKLTIAGVKTDISPILGNKNKPVVSKPSETQTETPKPEEKKPAEETKKPVENKEESLFDDETPKTYS